MVEIFWGVPTGAAVAAGHAGGARVSWQVGSATEAVMAVEAGCDLVVTQEIEAGGYVLRMCIRITRRRSSPAVPGTPCSPATSMTVATPPGNRAASPGITRERPVRGNRSTVPAASDVDQRAYGSGDMIGSR